MSPESPHVVIRLRKAYGFTEREQRWNRATNQHFEQILADEQTIIHGIHQFENSYGDFLWVNVSRPAGESHISLTFCGLGYEKRRGRWRRDMWFWHVGNTYLDKPGRGIPVGEARRQIEERRVAISHHIKPDLMSANRNRLLLSEFLKGEYPTASEILLSFPDEWELVKWVERETTPLYVAALPPSPERPRPDHFSGLPQELNLKLTTYRLYKFYEVWPQPVLAVSWNGLAGSGRVEAVSDLKINLRPIGQAQAWYGDACAVIWECYFHRSEHKGTWQDDLLTCWRAVEQDTGSAQFFTQPYEPTWEAGYTDFLRRLGYEQHPAYKAWWGFVRRTC